MGREEERWEKRREEKKREVKRTDEKEFKEGMIKWTSKMKNIEEEECGEKKEKKAHKKIRMKKDMGSKRA